MTNEEISKWLMNLKNDIGKTQYQPLWHYAEAINMAIEALENNDKLAEDLQNCLEMYKKKKAEVEALKQTDWIPCSEGMPKEGMRIIIQYGDGSLGVIERVSLKIWNLINSPYAKVVAWMPAPESWKGE